MIARRTTWLAVAAAMAMVVAAASACAREKAAPVAVEHQLEFGARRVQVTVPTGWDVLDQGAKKRFRRGEAELVMEDLGKVEWEPALASLHDDRRREVKSRRAITIENHAAVDIETWNRLDHTWPQRLLFVRADDDLLALQTTGLADADTVKAFESIRDSLHFVSARR
jgi:hypothetical protein